MNIQKKRIVKVVLFICIIGVLLYGITITLLPKISDFYEQDDWNVVFFGTSASYCSFNPAIFDEYELKTYNRGRQQQPINYTYYYIKDALETSNIDVVVLETLALTYWEGCEMFTNSMIRDNSFNDMRYSKIKYEAILDCVPKGQQMGYLFPLDKFHSNWESLDYHATVVAWKDVGNRYEKNESVRGYFGWESNTEISYLPIEERNSDVRGYVFGFNMKYLDLIHELCEEKGAQLVLTRVPLPCETYIIEEMNTIEDWAKEHNVPFINYMKMAEDLDMDWTKDSLDEGNHLNVFGAEKVSRHLAMYLKDEFFEYTY